MSSESVDHRLNSPTIHFGARALCAQIVQQGEQRSGLSIGPVKPLEHISVAIIAVHQARCFGLLSGQRRTLYQGVLQANRHGLIELPIMLHSGQYAITVQRNNGRTEVTDLVLD
jgi:hypothetical protein